MTLVPRKIYDAVGEAYRVAVKDLGASVGDAQAFILVDESGNPIGTGALATEATLETIADAAATLVDGTLVGADLTDKYGLPNQVDDGTSHTAWELQALTNAQLTAAGLATAAKQDITNSSLSTIDGHVDGIEGALTTLNAKDFATQTTLAATLTELYISNGSMAMQVDDAGSGVTYQGWAAPGTAVATAGWRIRRITATGDDYAIEWQDGDRNFDNKWTERISAAAYS